MDLWPWVDRYTRSIKSMGGPWLGDLTINASKEISPAELTRIFYDWLGYDVKESSDGQITWGGLVYEMELTINGITRRRSIDQLANYITATYTDSDDEVGTTAAASLAASVNKYGRKEMLLALEGVDQAAAEDNRDVILARNGWPYPRVVGMNPNTGQDRLEITLAGYIYTAQYRYATAGGGATGNASDLISALISTDCEFLTAGKIQSNTLPVYQGTRIPRRVWDLLADTTDLGDNAQNPWRIYVYSGPGSLDRSVHYGPVDPDPKYFIRAGQVYLTAGDRAGADPWRMQPAVARDMDHIVRRSDTGSWLTDSRDFYVSELSVSMDGGITYKTEEINDAEILQRQMENERYLERMAAEI